MHPNAPSRAVPPNDRSTRSTTIPTVTVHAAPQPSIGCHVRSPLEREGAAGGGSHAREAIIISTYSAIGRLTNTAPGVLEDDAGSRPAGVSAAPPVAPPPPPPRGLALLPQERIRPTRARCRSKASPTALSPEEHLDVLESDRPRGLSTDNVTMPCAGRAAVSRIRSRVAGPIPRRQGWGSGDRGRGPTRTAHRGRDRRRGAAPVPVTRGGEPGNDPLRARAPDSVDLAMRGSVSGDFHTLAAGGVGRSGVGDGADEAAHPWYCSSFRSIPGQPQDGPLPNGSAARDARGNFVLDRLASGRRSQNRPSP